MTLEQKIQKANSLKQEINDIKDFIEIIVDGQIRSNKSFVNAGLEQLKVLLKEKQEELEKMFS